MIDQNERDQQREALRATIARYAIASIDDYVRPELGVQMDFEALRPAIEPILATARVLTAAPLEVLPYRLVSMAQSAFGNVETRLTELKTFDMLALNQRNQNPVQVRQNYLNQFDPAEQAFWDHITPVLGFLASAQVREDKRSSELTELVATARVAVKETQSERDALKEIVRASRDVAADTGIVRYAALFSDEAKMHEAGSKAWLKATAWAAGVTVVTAIANYVLAFIGAATTGDLQLSLAKVLLFSVLLSATVWCGRNYRAARHNEVVNRHRHNALGTFEAFVHAASDDQTKNAVLLHAAQSIFAPQNSGLAGAEGDVAGPTQLIELVRNVGAPSK